MLRIKRRLRRMEEDEKELETFSFFDVRRRWRTKRRPRIVKAVKQDISFMEWKAEGKRGRKREKESE